MQVLIHLNQEKGAHLLKNKRQHLNLVNYKEKSSCSRSKSYSKNLLKVVLCFKLLLSPLFKKISCESGLLLYKIELLNCQKPLHILNFIQILIKYM